MIPQVAFLTHAVEFLPDGQLNPAHPEEFLRQQAAEDEILRNHPEYIRLASTDGAPVPTSSAFDVAKGLSYTRSTEAAELTRPSMIPWVVLGTVAFVALLNIVVVSLKLTAGLGHHRAATQRRPPHRGARSSKAKGRKTAAEPLPQCAAPSQPAAPLMKSKRKAKVGRATVRGDGEVAALEGALAAVPPNAREGGVAAEERYVGEDKLEKWRQDAAEREAIVGTDVITDAKAWKDIWGSGQGVGSIKKVQSAGAYVSELQAQYEAAKQRICGG